MKNWLLALCLIFSIPSISFALEEPDFFKDEKGEAITFKGEKIYEEYIEQCRNAKTGKYVKCPKEGENQGFIKQKLERRCRKPNGQFVKCPKA